MSERRVVLVHGFTQTGVSWAPVSALMSASVVTPDVPQGTDFTAVARALDEGAATYVGYSQGGRLCLQLALDRPEVVHELVLVSASPGIADDAERAARRDADERLAQEIERDGVDAFLAHWLAQPLFASLPPARAGLVDRRSRRNARSHLRTVVVRGCKGRSHLVPGSQHVPWHPHTTQRCLADVVTAVRRRASAEDARQTKP